MTHLRNLPGIALLGTICFLAAAEAASLEWDRTEVHVDMQYGQEEARAVFTATNPGRQPVHITRVQSSCGCTGTVLKQNKLSPGASTEIEVVFTKGNRQGLNRSRLRVYLNNEAQPSAILTLSAQIPTLISTRPGVLFWNPSSSEAARLIEIELDREHLQEIVEIHYNEHSLEVELKEDPQREGQFVLLVRPTRQDLAFRDTLRIMARGEGGKVGESRVQIFIQP